MGARSRISGLIAASLTQWLLSTPAEAATFDWFRFESVPGFLGDSVGGATLSITGSSPQASVLPASGRGSTFPHGFTPTGGNPNLQAAEIHANGDLLSAAVAAPSGDFTIECFVHLDTAPVASANTFVAYGHPTDPTKISWALQIRMDGAGGIPLRELTLGGYTGSSTLYFSRSHIVLDLAKDYYIAASFGLASPGQATFYVKNLTDNGPLQVVASPNGPLQAPIAGTLFTIGGLGNSPTLSMDGLIDEVRFSTHVVPEAQLLVNQIAPTPPVPLLPGRSSLMLALVFGLVGLHRVRAGSARAQASDVLGE